MGTQSGQCASKYWAWPFLFPVIERKVDVIAFRGWNLASRIHLDHDHVSLVMTIHFDPRPDLSLAQDQKLANWWKHWDDPCWVELKYNVSFLFFKLSFCSSNMVTTLFEICALEPGKMSWHMGGPSPDLGTCPVSLHWPLSRHNQWSLSSVVLISHTRM